MKQFSLFGMCAILGLIVGQSALASHHISGPYGDRVGAFNLLGHPTGPYYTYVWLVIEPPLFLPTPVKTTTSTPPSLIAFPIGREEWRDFIETPIALPSLTSARAFHEIDTSVDVDEGLIDITTLIGLKSSDYSGDDGPMTGFDPNSIPVILSEGYYGASGALYSSHSHDFVTIANLSSTFPEFDLSQWGGDPNSVVQVFQTIVPAADRPAVPEPTTLFLFGAGATALIGARRTRSNASVRIV
jgi:hypothetical protein